MKLLHFLLTFSYSLVFSLDATTFPSFNLETSDRAHITERFLHEFSIEKIVPCLEIEEGCDIALILKVFDEAIAQEKPGFFGYHATTLKHWVFNEIIKHVLTLREQIPFRDHFYFLRSPLAQQEQIQDVTAFLSSCTKKRDCSTFEEKKGYISFALLKLIDRNDLIYNEEVANQVFEALLFFSPLPSKLTKEETQRRLTDFIGINGFQIWLQKRADREIFSQYLEALPIEELLENSRIYSPLVDTEPTQQKLLVSLNIPLFGNFTIPTESTAHVFIKGQSIDSSADEILETATEEFLASYGFPKGLGNEIFKQAEAIISLQQGILLQFFDDPDYSHLDQVSFICMGFNSLYEGKRSSEFITTFDPAKDIAQLRLLITKDTLDPKSSWLTIKQYDLVPLEKKAEIKKLIAQKLEDFIQIRFEQ